MRTTGGDIEAETVVIACGVWSPKIARMAGAKIPLTPAVHQMISVGPCPQLSVREGEISFPIVRDMDTFCYERQHGADMEVGSYAHRPILQDPEDIPSIDQAKLSPTEMPFTEEDFDPQLEQAFELMPDLLGAEGAEIRYAINGLLSLTPDGWPILGETPEVKGLWSAAAVWIKEGPGVGRAVAEWMTHGHSRDRHQPLQHRPLLPPPADPRARQGAHVGGLQQDLRDHPPGRAVRVRPRPAGCPHARLAGRAGCLVLRGGRLGAPVLVRIQCRPAGGVRRPVMPREHEWDSRWWSPIINAEHLRMRESAGIIDLSAFAIFDVVGDGALDTVQRASVAAV